MKYKLKNQDIVHFNETADYCFPKYTTQLMNLANQNAQGTRHQVVGQMSELFPEFMESGQAITIEDWKKWYTAQNPDAINKATDKVYAQVQNLRDAIPLIDRQMVNRWVEDLVINKTFNGLYVQKAILASLAQRKGTTYRLATPEEESRGIDGYVGDKPYSVKPDSYKSMSQLSEHIDVTMIYYSKIDNGLRIEVEE